MKKTIAIILEVIPLFSAFISFMLIKLNNNSELLKHAITITMLLAFFGFIFFFVGKKLNKTDKIVQILGILDLLATLYVIVLYTIVIFSFGL